MEYEVKILEIDVKAWIEYLESHGAIKKGEWLQRRKIYDFKPVHPHKWLRLRTNGEETTLTIKEILDKTKVGGVREVEIMVSDFDKTSQILEELGFSPRSFQENRRTRYIYQGVEFDFDEWPLLPTYLEIEGTSQEEVMQILKEIPLDQSRMTTFDVDSIYLEEYGIQNNFKILTFEEQKR